MTTQMQMLITLGVVFLAVAVLVGVLISFAVSRSSHGRRRLSELRQATKAPEAVPGLVVEEVGFKETETSGWSRLVRSLPTSRGSVKRLRRELELAGLDGDRAGALLSIAELTLPVLLAVPAFILLDGMVKWGGVGLGVMMGYLGPGFLLSMLVKKRQRQIEDGLADTLDLLVLCLEAGSSLDQAIIKASEELSVAYPALGQQLRILISELRAGVPRIDAFRGFADRSQVHDVRGLVSMLIQTDKFGTSVAQALRTHAVESRTKRRQRAEERAQKVGVKLVFPLVFCLFPALYVVMLGPAFLQLMEVFGQ